MSDMDDKEWMEVENTEDEGYEPPAEYLDGDETDYVGDERDFTDMGDWVSPSGGDSAAGVYESWANDVRYH